jgi:REP element-mobilizing transposase RayT
LVVGMARAPRIEFEGAVYHVTARGNERRRIYRSDEDRRLFLATLEQMRVRCGIILHCFCLMPNHFHLGGQKRGQSLLLTLADRRAKGKDAAAVAHSV